MKIIFWKTIAWLLDKRHNYTNYPWSSTDLVDGQDEYAYPEGVVVLYDYNKGNKKHIIFVR